MNVLFHGRPYCTSLNPVPLYRGRHDVRTLGIEGDVDYLYDPVQDTFQTVYERIAPTWRPDLIVCWTQEDCHTRLFMFFPSGETEVRRRLSEGVKF